MSKLIRKIKREKWDRINIRTSEEKKRGFKIHNQETKKYLGIEYDLISLESYSERRWVALESNFKFPKGLILVLKGHFSLRDDFLYYDSAMWEGHPIEYQWDIMDKIARQQIDELYQLYENSDDILKNKINNLTTIITNLKDFIKSLGSE